jgi:Holliday junction resolvasome RuvABC endonuclease subunit
VDEARIPKVPLEAGLTIIGMDPAATRNCGWSVLRYDGNSIILLDKYTQKITRTDEELDCGRLRDVYDELQKIITKHNPKILCLERSMGGGLAFVRSNMSEIVGAAKLCCFENKIIVYETSPGHVKKLIADHGRADKKYIKANIVTYFNLAKSGPEHECDAAACALSAFIDLGFLKYIVKVPYGG